MLFCSDVFQIPPLATDLPYIHFHSNDEELLNVSQFQKDVSSLERRGYQIWREITHVIILEGKYEIKRRFQHYKCLQNLLFGIFTKEGISLLNSIVFNQSTSMEIEKLNARTVLIVVNTNTIGNATNWKCIGHLSKNPGTLTTIVCANYNQNGDRKNYNESCSCVG